MSEPIFKSTTEITGNWKKADEKVLEGITGAFRIPFHCHELAGTVIEAIDKVKPDDALPYLISEWNKDIVTVEDWTAGRNQGLKSVSMEKALIYRHKESMCDNIKEIYVGKMQVDLSRIIQHKDSIKDKIKLKQD